MKKEHEKVIKNMLEDIRQIPGYVTGMGSRSAFLESYISAAKDYQEAHEHEVVILDAIFQSESFSALLRKKDIDRCEIEGSVEYYEEIIQRHSKELHEFIEFRKSRKWK